MSSVTLRWLSKKCRLLSKKRALHVRFAPKATEVLRCRDLMAVSSCSKCVYRNPDYSITSLARASSVEGIVRPIAFAVITAPARGDKVVPVVAAATRPRHDMITREIAIEMFGPAVQTHIAIAAEQRLIRQRRHMPERRYDAAFARNDAVDVHMRP